MIPETVFTAIRNVQRAPRTYRVFTKRGPTCAMWDYAAPTAEAAIALARADLAMFEEVASRL